MSSCSQKRGRINLAIARARIYNSCRFLRRKRLQIQNDDIQVPSANERPTNYMYRTSTKADQIIRIYHGRE